MQASSVFLQFPFTISLVLKRINSSKQKLQTGKKNFLIGCRARTKSQKHLRPSESLYAVLRACPIIGPLHVYPKTIEKEKLPEPKNLLQHIQNS